MKFSKISIVITLFLLIFSGCSKDLGNYDYQSLNKVDSVLLRPGVPLASNVFSVIVGETLKISPLVFGSKDNKDQYDFLWVIGKDTVGQEKDLDFNTEGVKPGTLLSNLFITDKNTNATYNIHFTVNLSASVTRGYYLLAEDADENAYLFFKGNDLTSHFFHINNFDGYVFGKKPLNLQLEHYATSATNGIFSSITVATREGEYPIIVGDTKSSLATLLFSRDNPLSVDPLPSGFNPSRVKFEGTGGTAIIDGKVRVLNRNVIGMDVYDDPLDYDFRDGDYYINEMSFSGLFLMGYDYKNERLRVFASPADGNSNSYETDLGYLIQGNFKGHDVVGGVEDYVTWVNNFVLTKNGDELAIHRFDYSANSTNGYMPESYLLVGRKRIPEAQNAVGFRYRTGSGFWYFAKGRKLYRFSNSGLDVQEVLSLPDDGTGDITAWNFDYNMAGQFSHIVIATFNPNASKPYKGSVYTYGINGARPLNIEKEVTYKVVDLKCGYLPY